MIYEIHVNINTYCQLLECNNRVLILYVCLYDLMV